MQLGFVAFEVASLATWDDFLTRAIGAEAIGGGRYRHDGHAWRLQLTEGPADDLVAIGWELDDHELDATLTRLRAAGVDIAQADPSVRDARRRFTLTDPAGIPTELCSGLARASEPFASRVVRGGFVADDLGLGHIVLSTLDKSASVAFYTELLGARLSDHIVTEFHGHPVDISFFHVNPRHHSVAFGGAQKKRLHHLMVEVHTVDDVGAAFDRFLRRGYRIFQSIGRHPNDGMVSFYAFTPSGFQIEVGCDGRTIDDTTWVPTTYDRISDWGHTPLAMLAPKPKPAGP